MVKEIERLDPQAQLMAGVADPPSTNSETSDWAEPRNAARPTTVPSITGRSWVDPSPLLSTPVVALYGRADASDVTVPTVM